MDASADYEAPGVIYRANEGGETVPCRRNDPHWVELFNAFISKRREEGAASVWKGERRMRENSWFPHGGVTGGYNNVVVCGGDRQSKSDNVWIDMR
jgi:hypothetical protein